MTATIHAELTADGERLVLIGVGSDIELARATRGLALLTPLIKPTEPAGGMTLPVSWPAVVQLSATFGAYWRPGPALLAWMTEQVRQRVSAPIAEPTVNAAGYTPRVYQLEGAAIIAATGRTLIFDEPGPQPVDTPILTPLGWTTLGELHEGSIVFDLNGRPAHVRTVKHFGVQQVYRVTFNDRTSTLATGDHRWRVYTHNDRKRRSTGRVLSTTQLAAAGLRHADGGAEFFLPQQPVLDGWHDTHKDLDPYAYGALLGNGCLGGESLAFTSPDEYTLARVEAAARVLATTTGRDAPRNGCQNLRFHRNGGLRRELASLDALHGSAGKYVHYSYKCAGTMTRRAVLAGLLDTDGTVTDTGAAVEFSSASPMLAEDVAWLARSLGAVVTESDPQPASYRNASGERVECLPKHRVHMRFPADGPNPFEVSRKADAWADQAARVQRRNPPRTFQDIVPAGGQEVCCIELDTDDEHARVYLTDTALIPTHNTGKSATTVLGLVQRAAAGHVAWPALIIAPASVVDPWLEQFAIWAPQLRTAAWRGTPAARRELIGTAEVYVTSYDVARIDSIGGIRPSAKHNPLLKLAPRSIVADECHLIKNASTARTRAVGKLAAKAENFVALSGTPITHHPADLWPSLVALAPGAWPSRERWVGRYCVSLPGDYGEDILGLAAHREEEFRRTITGQHRRVAKADVLTQLPPKVYTVRSVELPEDYRRAYDSMESQMIASMPDGEELSVMDVLSKLGVLSTLACAAAEMEITETVEIIDGIEVRKQRRHTTLKAPSWKVDALLEVLAERPGRPVIAAAPSRQLMMLAGAAATAAGLAVGYVVGGQSAAERTENVARFQAGELDLICVTTGAGGVGITLTAADTIVFLQRPWSLVESIQMEDRAHRIGSEIHESIEVIDIVAKNTIDTRFRAVLRERAGQLADLVKDPRIVEQLLGGDNVRRISGKKAA